MLLRSLLYNIWVVVSLFLCHHLLQELPVVGQALGLRRAAHTILGLQRAEAIINGAAGSFIDRMVDKKIT